MSDVTLQDRWLAAWPTALAAWSRYVQLHSPLLCVSSVKAASEGLEGSFAMIRLSDQSVVVDLEQVAAKHLEEYAVEVLAHEIGHHVYAPATLADHARMLARMRKALPTLEAQAPYVANLYTDLMINDRLQRVANLRMHEVYRRLKPAEGKTPNGWRVYLRIYELLWSLEPGALGSGGRLPDHMEGDAWLGARLVRHYANDMLAGAGGFASLLLPYLVEDGGGALPNDWHDTRDAGKGGEVDGLTEADPDEGGARHPSQDPALGEDTVDPAPEPARATVEAGTAPDDKTRAEPARGQARQPYEYGELLRAAGLVLDDHEVAVRYYKERAQPHLIRFPSRPSPRSFDTLPEGLEPWDFGHPIDAADWIQSVMQSPRIVPGLTTVQRVYGESEDTQRRPTPLDLDIYVDSSGSMPNPQRLVSYLTLAGAILCYSALRAGARVQATLWSGKHQVMSTQGFVRDPLPLMQVLTGFYGGGTQFPIPTLRDTYLPRTPTSPAAHILVISDDGVSTMFDRDEENNSGWEIARMALARARGGGTLLLNLMENWEEFAQAGANRSWINESATAIVRARNEGWNVHRVSAWEDLVTFARAFSSENYGTGETRKAAA